MVGGDDLTFHSTFEAIDATNPRAIVSQTVRFLARDAPPLERVATVGRFLATGSQLVSRMRVADCEAADKLAQRLGLSHGVRQGLAHIWTRWDGRGFPAIQHDQIALPARLSLAAAGASVEEARMPVAERAFELFAALFGADDGAAVQHLLAMVGTAEPSPLLHRLGGILHTFAMPTAAFGGLLAQVDIARAEILGFMLGFDAVLAPVTASPAVAHGTSLDDGTLPGFGYAMLHNLSGLPSVVVRAGTSPEGLPIGVQIIARPWREDVALAIGQHLQTALGGWRMPSL